MLEQMAIKLVLSVQFVMRIRLIRFYICVDICVCVMSVQFNNGVVLAVDSVHYVVRLFVMLSELISHDKIDGAELRTKMVHNFFFKEKKIDFVNNC